MPRSSPLLTSSQSPSSPTTAPSRCTPPSRSGLSHSHVDGLQQASPQPAFAQQRYYGADFLDLLLQPRSELYGTADNAPRLDIKYRRTLGVSPGTDRPLRTLRNQTPTYFVDSDLGSDNEAKRQRHPSSDRQPYRDQCSSPKANNNHVEEDDPMVSYLDMAATPRRAKRKASVIYKAGSKLPAAEKYDPKKHRSRRNMERPTKIRKMNHDVVDAKEQEVGGTTLTLSNKGSSAQLAIVLDSGEEDDLPLTTRRRSKRLKTQEPMVKEEAATETLTEVSTEHQSNNPGIGLGTWGNGWSFPAKIIPDKPNDEANLLPTIPSTQNAVNAPIVLKAMANASSKPPSTHSDNLARSQMQTNLAAKDKRIKELEEELARTKRDYDSKISILRQEHESKLRQTKDKFDALQCTVTEQEEENAKQIALLEKEASDLVKRNAELEVEAASFKAENAALKADKKALQDQLHTETKARKELTKTLDNRDILCDAEAFKSSAQPKDVVEGLKRQLHRTALSPTPAPTPATALTPTPTLSSFSSGVSEQTKADNIRKVYIKVKRKYDNMRSAAMNISAATSSMDLGSFGLFGQYLKTMRETLDENDRLDEREREDGGGLGLRSGRLGG